MTQANYTGSVLEWFILSWLDERGCTFVPRNRSTPVRILGQPFFTRKFHFCQSIYATVRYGDFFCYHTELWPDPLVIETK